MKNTKTTPVEATNKWKSIWNNRKIEDIKSDDSMEIYRTLKKTD